MANIIEQSFSIQLPVMRFLGIYPSKTPSTFQKVKGYTLHFILMVVVTILVTIGIFYKNDSLSDERNLMVMFVAEVACVGLKIIPFIRYSEQIKNCVEYFGHSRFVPRDDEERRIANDCVKACRRNALIFAIMLTLGLSGWILTPLFAKGYQLPMDVWLPYNPMSGRVVFYLTFIFLSAACIYDASSGPLIDPLIGGLAYHATGQLKILKYNLLNLAEHVRSTHYTHQDEISAVNFEDVCEFLERCVNHHNDILTFINEFEECFSFSVFCQIIGCTFAICFSCMGLIMAPSGSFSAFKYFIYFSIFSSQILFYCYYGTLLFEENNGFVSAIYLGRWYEYDVKIRKILIIMMERSKQPIILSAGKIVKLTLETFTSLLKTSYSLMAVLNNNSQ